MAKPSLQALAFVPKNKKSVDFDILQKQAEIRLWSNTSFTEINSILAKYFGFSKQPSKIITLEDIFKEVADNEVPDIAYLGFVNSREIELYSGCCFDFYQWRELETISPNRCDVWLGHSPTVDIKFNEKADKYIVWDSELHKINKAIELDEYIEFERGELEKVVKIFKQDLIGFAQKLDTWSKQFDKETADTVVCKIKNRLGIEK